MPLYIKEELDLTPKSNVYGEGTIESSGRKITNAEKAAAYDRAVDQKKGQAIYSLGRSDAEAEVASMLAAQESMDRRMREAEERFYASRGNTPGFIEEAGGTIRDAAGGLASKLADSIFGISPEEEARNKALGSIMQRSMQEANADAIWERNRNNPQALKDYEEMIRF